jgi:hypothetical protein
MVTNKTRRSIRIPAGATLMWAAAGWSMIAPWLSANNFIAVRTELISYWAFLIVLMFAASAFLGNLRYSIPTRLFVLRSLGVVCVSSVFMAGWLSSDKAFLHWKMRSIRGEAWPQMAFDLESLGREVAESGTAVLPASRVPPKSLLGLGSRLDYTGAMGSVLNSPQYTGIVANVTFGYKVRSWGLFLGPEEGARSYCRGGACLRVAPNAYFFVGPRG